MNTATSEQPGPRIETTDLVAALYKLRGETDDRRVRVAVDRELAILESGGVYPPAVFEEMTRATRELLATAAREKAHAVPPPANRHERRARAARERQKANRR